MHSISVAMEIGRTLPKFFLTKLLCSASNILRRFTSTMKTNTLAAHGKATRQKLFEGELVNKGMQEEFENHVKFQAATTPHVVVVQTISLLCLKCLNFTFFYDPA